MKVFVIAAITLDGFIGRDASQVSIYWTSPEDSKMYRRITKEAGVTIYGSRTFDTIMRGLPGRKTIVVTSHPDTYANIENVEATSDSPAEIIQRLESEGQAQVAVCGGSTIYYQFLEAGLVDELYITVEPLLFGTGVPLISDKLETKLQLLEVKHLNDNTLQLFYKVLK
nr:Dihydrofolate reductase [uncultured bacterium]AIA13791.1 Dihydrofolate reductase [uncultured bacterium]AIA13914.1 Dihydrofolate reductase [uncultured bacterium]